MCAFGDNYTWKGFDPEPSMGIATYLGHELNPVPSVRMVRSLATSESIGHRLIHLNQTYSSHCLQRHVSPPVVTARFRIRRRVPTGPYYCTSAVCSAVKGPYLLNGDRLVCSNNKLNLRRQMCEFVRAPTESALAALNARYGGAAIIPSSDQSEACVIDSRACVHERIIIGVSKTVHFIIPNNTRSEVDVAKCVFLISNFAQKDHEANAT
ncbi:hypothetical protein EVAR_37578_1 [Eumeta japonica]|uniref:Uncharacterized protein n=1 Tax=Eumeta variegata TaxID=151549 RepID=A0A4C1VP87_EUMVA|nr:hypothetical protein EVAR_37578_1 [Eumeta japonica]